MVNPHIVEMEELLKTVDFLCPRNVLNVTLSVCLSVCHSVAKHFNLGHNFLTVRERDFIFVMRTKLMKPFKITPRSMTL